MFPPGGAALFREKKQVFFYRPLSTWVVSWTNKCIVWRPLITPAGLMLHSPASGFCWLLGCPCSLCRAHSCGCHPSSLGTCLFCCSGVFSSCIQPTCLGFLCYLLFCKLGCSQQPILHRGELTQLNRMKHFSSF